jgi:hypothetical protein
MEGRGDRRYRVVDNRESLLQTIQYYARIQNQKLGKYFIKLKSCSCALSGITNWLIQRR